MLKIVGDKSGQMKIQQMAFMLVAVVIFFVLIGLAVLAVNMSSLEEKASDLERKNARLLVKSLADSPEFSCGNAFGTSKSTCIDVDKAMALKDNMDVYDGFWDVKSIKVRRLFPSENSGECKPSNYPDCKTINIVSENDKGGNFTSIDTFVSLCRKDFDRESNRGYDNCEIGKLLVSYQNVG